MRRLITVLTLIILIMSVSCNNNDKMSPEEEASNIIGLPIPLPTYLPEGYEIVSVDVEDNAEHRFWNISVLISSFGTTGKDSRNSIYMNINWISLGLKIQAEKVNIGERTALVFRETDRTQLIWIDSEGRQITLTGNADVEFEEIVKIAESVTSPPSKILEASLEPQDDLLMLRNESKQLSVHLKNNSLKAIKVFLARDDDLPEGIQVKLHDDSFTMRPGESKDIRIDVKVDSVTPSPAWPHRTASDIFPEDMPPPYTAILEAAYYRLAFTYVYEISGVVCRQERLSARLRVDSPTTLPSGMVTLQEAEKAADFPVGILLPSYLPEEVSPPPIGYEIGDEEPYCITACYSKLRVVLCPEPGVSEPPEDVIGERTFIHKKPVVIGQRRIDWWVYDIHFSVISDEVPMNELKLVAESMMLVGPYSGSWLGIGP